MTDVMTPRTAGSTRTAARPDVPSWALRSTTAVLVLLTGATLTGVLTDVYDGETQFARNAYRGADLVSLLLAVPLLVLALGRARKGSRRGYLLWIGALAYVGYQYGYVFAYRWTRMFPVYLALLVLATWTVAGALIALKARVIAAGYDRSTPVRGVARFLTTIAVGLAVIELAQIAAALVTGDPPQLVTDSGHPTSPVYVLDLGLAVPLMLLAAHWLRKGSDWGYVLAPVMLVKGVTVGLGLLAANLFAATGSGKTDGPLNVLWVVIAVGSASALWALLCHVHDSVDAADDDEPGGSAMKGSAG